MSRRLIAACALISAAALTPAQSIATGTVGPNEINAAVLPIDAAGAVLPIDVRDSIDPLEVQRTQGATSVITVSADVLFACNKATLTAPALQTIANVARRIPHRGGITVKVDGYTDSIGTAAYNDALSQRRAAAVAAALKRDLNGGATQILATGRGEADPVAPNELNGKDNPAGRAKNRRVTIAFPRS